MFPRVAAILACIALVLAGNVVAAPLQAECQFVLGFKVVHDMIPEIVGDCRTNEYHNATNGDGLQETTGGLLVWRKADNWTAFTDGYRTWINGPNGLQQRLNTERFGWETDPITMVLPVPVDTPTTTPMPQVNYYVETSSRPTDVRPGGSLTLCARLSGEGAPPVIGVPARIVYQGVTYAATAQAPDGNACVTVSLSVQKPTCSFEGYITYEGREIATPPWAHREHCRILPY